jgi:hypothetical protein
MNSSPGTVILNKINPEKELQKVSNSGLIEWVRMLLHAETAMERLKPDIQAIQEKRELARQEIFKRVPHNGQIETPYGKIQIQTIESSSSIGYEKILEWIRDIHIPGTILPETTTNTKSLSELLEEDFKKHFQQTSPQGQKGYRRLTFTSNRKKTRRRKPIIESNHRVLAIET